MFGDIAASEWLMLIVHWVHATGAVIWIGGSAFFVFVIRPVEITKPDLIRPALSPIGAVYRELVDISVIAIIVTGIILMFDRITGNEVTTAWMVDLLKRPSTKIFHNASYDVGWLLMNGFEIISI